MVKIHKSTKSTCLICCSDIEDNKGVLLHKTRRQTHALCLYCADGYLKPIFKQKINNYKDGILNDVLNVKCPGSYCGESRNQCKHILDIRGLEFHILNDCDDFQELYLDLFRLQYVINNNNVILCANKNCGQVFEIHPGEWRCHILCFDCGYDWCRNCHISPYHVGKSCVEYQLENNATAESMYINSKIKEGVVKLCPCCKVPTEKVRNSDGTYVGCNKIVCSVCGINWCWLCMEVNIDYDHFNVNSISRCANKLWDGVVL